MQGFEGEGDAGGAGGGEDGFEPVAHHGPRAGEVFRAGGQAAADHDEAGGVQRMGLLDGAQIVFDGGGAAGGIGGWEHAAAAQAGDGEPRVTDLPRCRRHAHGVQHIAPG